MDTESSNSFKISKSYTAKQYLDLELDEGSFGSEDWKIAQTMFRDRFEERYFRPIEKLLDSEEAIFSSTSTVDSADEEGSTCGFIVLSLSFQLSETLQQFREGRIREGNERGSALRNFLMGLRATADEPIDEVKANSIKSRVRDALLHSAGTDGVKVKRTGNMFRFNGNDITEINRTEFYRIVKYSYISYADSLVQIDQNPTRINFVKKMRHICRG